MNRLFALAALGGALAAAAAPAPAAPGSVDARTGAATIVWSGFGGRTDDAAAKYLFAPFTRATGIKVVLDPSSETIVAKLRAAAAAHRVPWSVARAEEEDAVVLEDSGLLEPMPTALRQKLEHVLGKENVTRYGPGYIDYSSVLVCNRALVARCPTSIRDFFDTRRFPGRRTMFAGGWLENLVFALEADGVPRAQLFPVDVNRAFHTLDGIRDDVSVWWTNSQQSEQLFRDGEVAMGTIWSGRAALLATSDPRFEVSFDGAVRARELLVVPKGAPHPQEAWRLIEWYATHPKADAAFTKERLIGLAVPRSFSYLPAAVTRHISTAPANTRRAVPIDFGWVRQNRDAVFQRWQEWLTR